MHFARSSSVFPRRSTEAQVSISDYGVVSIVRAKFAVLRTEDLIACLLAGDAKKRPEAEEVLQHAWLLKAN